MTQSWNVRSTPERIPHKRGDSFVLGCQAADAQGQPVDLSAYTIAAQVRRNGQLVADLTVEFVDRIAGAYELRAPGDSTTPAWPVGTLEVDVEYRMSGTGGAINVRSTDTFWIEVSADVTQRP